MGYTIKENNEYQEIRLVSHEGKLMSPVSLQWHCDPCAKSSERFTIMHPSGYKEACPWYRVVLKQDTLRDIEEKISHTLKVNAAREKVAQAITELNKLEGR